MNLTKSNGTPHFGNIAKMSGVNKHTIRSAGMRGIDVTDIAALRQFRDSKNQRNSETNRKRCAVVRANDPLNQKIRELRQRNYGYKEIGMQVGISKGAVHKRCERMGLDGRRGSQKRFNPNGMVMWEYQRDVRVMQKMDWRNHPGLAKEHDRLKYHRTKTPESMRLQADKAKAYYEEHKHCPKYKASRRKKFERWRKRPRNKIRSNLSTQLWIAINERGGKKNHSILQIIGCGLDALINHLEMQWTRGMNWDNYGDGWHVDHIVPCSYFDLTIYDEQCRCFHFSNLRPLWAQQNISEGNRRGAMTAPLGI